MKDKKFKTAKIVTHYSIEDQDCEGEYWDIDVLIDGVLVAQFGSYYDDKGEFKLEGFIKGIEFAQGKKLKIVKVVVADRD